jgi:hypothetical protein
VVREVRKEQNAYYKRAVQSCDGFLIDVERYSSQVEKLNNEAKRCKDLI